MVYKLTLQNHVEGLSQNRWVFTPPAVAGREPDSQLCIEHDSISRKHCQFSLNAEGALVIKDLDSMIGTYVDDTRVQHATLMPGQLIQIGALPFQMTFRTKTVTKSKRRLRGLRGVSMPLSPCRHFVRAASA